MTISLCLQERDIDIIQTGYLKFILECQSKSYDSFELSLLKKLL